MARKAPKPTDTPTDTGAETPTRGRGRKKAEANAPAVLDQATYEHHVDQLVSASLRLEDKLRECASERGILANAKKAAKKAGVPVDAVMKALALKKRPAGEVVSEYRDIGRALKYLEAPLGTQWGLFNDVETVDVMDADAAGYHAGKNNEPKSNNPHQAATEEFVKWDGGWDRWVAENVPGAKKVADPAKDKVEAEFAEQGREAYRAGTEISENPYGENAKAHACWREGWIGEQNAKAAAEEMLPIPDALRRGKKAAAVEGAATH
jgi:hypothetical protein